MTGQNKQGVKRKGDYLPEDELTPANKKQKISAIDAMLRSESCMPLTTNEMVKKVKDLLHQYYQAPAYAELKRLLHERTFPITESFINLAIVKEHEQKPKEDEQLKAVKTLSREEYINSFETIYQPKAPIKIEDLLIAHGDENQIPKRQLIEGRAGIGKTTLCQYLAHQWAAGNSKWDVWRQQFDWVIHLLLRQLTAKEQYDFSKLTLINWIYKHSLTSIVQQSFTEAEFVEAWQVLNVHGKVLLLLDGYDEIVPALKSNASFQQFFEQELLSCAHWFIFSRPYYFTDNCVERRLENIGFTQEDIFKYVQQYFRDIEKEKHISQQTYADSLISYLKQNPNAKGIAHIPINLELLCYTWENGKNSLHTQLTLTQLYDHLVLSLFGRYLHKFYPQDIASPSGITWNDLQTDTEYNCQQMLAFLEQLAWHQMQESGLIISVNIIKKLVSDLYPSLKQKSQREVFGEVVLKQLGLLKGCDSHKPALEQSYYFVHLTFQEYFAARHWSKLFQYQKTQEEAIQFLQVNKFNPRYEMVWKMVAGLLSVNNTNQNQYFDILLNEPKDLVGLNQLLLQIQCLEETCSKETCLDANKYNRIILNNLSKWINFQIHKKLYFGYHIANYLAFCPNLMCQDEIINLWSNLLNNPDEAVKIYTISFLEKAIQLPDQLLIELLNLLGSALKNGKSLNIIHHIEIVLVNQSILSKPVFERLLFFRGYVIFDQMLVKVLSKPASFDNEIILNELEQMLVSNIYTDKVFAARILSKFDKIPERILLKLINLLRSENDELLEAVSKTLAKQVMLPDSVNILLWTLYQNNWQDQNKYILKIFLHNPYYKHCSLDKVEAWLKETDINKLLLAVDILYDQKNLPITIINELIALAKYINVNEDDIIVDNDNFQVDTIQANGEIFRFSYKSKYCRLKFEILHILLNQKELPIEFFAYYLSLIKESGLLLKNIYLFEIMLSHAIIPDTILEYLVTLLSEIDPFLVENLLRIINTPKVLSSNIIDQLVSWLESNNKKLQSYAINILSFHNNVLPKSSLKQIYAFLQDNSLHSEAAIILSNQLLELKPSDISELIERLNDAEKRNSILKVLSSLSHLDQDVFYKLDSQLFSQGLFNDYLLVIKNVSLQSIAMILKSEWDLPNSLALIHALFMKSLQANIPVYFVKDVLYLGNNKIPLNIEKTLVIEAFTQVISTITGWELESTANVSKAKKAVYAACENQAFMNNNTNLKKDAALTNTNTKNMLQTHPTTTTSVLAPKLSRLAPTNFFQSEKNIQPKVPKHYTVHINQQTLMFEVKTVAGNSDFGYMAFGISRTQAYQLLINHLNEICSLIKPALQEAIRTQAFIDRLINKDSLTQALSIAYENYVQASRDGEMPQGVLEALDRAGEDLTIQLAYIEYDIKDKRIDAGWSHPCILFALAEIQDIELHLWQLNEQGQLQAHPYYPNYIPSQINQRTDLLFVNNNHFELLESIASKENSEKSNINKI